MNLGQIKLELAGRRFPQVLDDTDFNAVLTAALRDIDEYGQITAFGFFFTQEGVQDYRIFDPDDTVTNGFAANAYGIEDMLWNPGSNWDDTDIFSPGWALSSQVMYSANMFFTQPSQFMLIRQQMDAWRKQFGNQGYDVIGDIGDPDSFLRIYPVPQEDGDRVLVQFTTGNQIELIKGRKSVRAMQWIEFRYAEALANHYAQTAGVDLLGFADSTSAMKYWEGRANRLKTEAMAKQAGIQGNVERSY